MKRTDWIPIITTAIFLFLSALFMWRSNKRDKQEKEEYERQMADIYKQSLEDKWLK